MTESPPSLFFTPGGKIGSGIPACWTPVIGCWFALPGVLWLGIAADHRWQAARIGLESQALSLILILWGVARAWADFDQTNPLTWLFVGGMALLLFIIVVVYGRLEFGRHS